jgi:hypothetical protein
MTASPAPPIPADGEPPNDKSAHTGNAKTLSNQHAILRIGSPPPKWFAARGDVPACALQISQLCAEIWSAEAQLPPNAEAKLQHSKKLSDERYRS